MPRAAVRRPGLSLQRGPPLPLPAGRAARGHLRWDRSRTIRDEHRRPCAGGRAARRRRSRSRAWASTRWGVDYGLVDEAGALVEDPICLPRRRAPTARSSACCARCRARSSSRAPASSSCRSTRCFSSTPRARRAAGPGAAPADDPGPVPPGALRLDDVGEYTNAITTQLVDARTRDWDRRALRAARAAARADAGAGGARDADSERCGPSWRGSGLAHARDRAGDARHRQRRRRHAAPAGLGLRLVGHLVARRRRASRRRSSNEAVARANFTNEGGACGTIRFLKNVMGLWILESVPPRVEGGAGERPRGAACTAAAGLGALAGRGRSPTTRASSTPPSMMRRAARGARRVGPARRERAGARSRSVVLDSLALRYASVDRHARGAHRRARPRHPHRRRRLPQRLPEPGDRRRRAPAGAGGAGRGHGARATCSLQAIASGRLASLADGRRLVEPPRRFEPRENAALAALAERYRELEASAARV